MLSKYSPSSYNVLVVFAQFGRLKFDLVFFFFRLFVSCLIILSLVRFQQSPEHFLEVKLESYNTRFFHIKEDFAFTEVRRLQKLSLQLLMFDNVARSHTEY